MNIDEMRLIKNYYGEELNGETDTGWRTVPEELKDKAEVMLEGREHVFVPKNGND
jgi:hypothetical protein